MEAKDWYTRRNDRINRIENVRLDSLSDKPIAVVISKLDIHRYSNQLMALISLNLISKWNNNITIEIDASVECCLPNHSNTKLKEVVEKEIFENDPFGKFTFTESVDISEYKYILIIGNDIKQCPDTGIWIDSYNWISGVANSPLHYFKPECSVNNPVGPAFASCLGVGLLFKLYNEDLPIKDYRKWYSLFDYRSANSPDLLQNPGIDHIINMGDTFQIGCGAVGSSLDYLLSLSNLKGKIFLIDFDNIIFENISSSLIFNFDDADKEIKKIEACKRSLLKNQSLEVLTFDGDYSSFIKSIDYYHQLYPNTILCLANERNVWSTIQYNYPPLVFHATTSPNWTINFGRHIPQKEWCIVCRFGIESFTHVPKCSTGIIEDKNNGESHLGTLPFLSPAAATLVLTDLIKRSIYPSYPICQENFIQFSMNLSPTNEFILIANKKRDICPICKFQSLRDYPSHFIPKFSNML